MTNTTSEIFRLINIHTDQNIKVTVSFLEIYNETIRDLIVKTPDTLDLREDPKEGSIVAGLSEHVVQSSDEILELLLLGNKNRIQEVTLANKTSSRSHAVFRIKVENTNNSNMQKKVGMLSLIDLAGSERAASTGNRGIRMVEGANINKSLLALGNCINMLYENSIKAKRGHIPFRDSKLTRLLKNSLGGNCRTVMIANVSPFASHYDET